MPEKKDHIKTYTVADFERYYAGKMPEQEMHALEKAALDDTFLFDALEGYQYTQSATKDIDELKNKLIKKEEDDKKIIWFKRKTVANILRIAALIILITGAGLIIYKNNNTNKKEIAVLNKKIASPEMTTKKITDSTTMYGDKTITAERKQLKISSEEYKPFVTTTTKPVTIHTDDNSFTLSQDAAVTVNDSVRQTDKDFYTVTKSAPAGNAGQALAGKVAGIEVKSERKNMPLTFRGRITDINGSPVSFATISDKKKKINIQSNDEGLFSFSTDDSSPKVNVNAAGYKTLIKELKKDSLNNNLVMLEPDNTLKEVVITPAYATKREMKGVSSSVKAPLEDIKTARVSVTNAIPVNGWQKFNKYISDSLKTVQQLGGSSVPAEVSVSFNVDEKGKPIDISAKKSLCSLCDEEAVRIIKNGPTWRLNKKRKNVKALVRF